MENKKPREKCHADVTPSQIQGVKFLRNILKLLRPLHEHEDCPNRQLHYDEYAAFILVYFFTPALTSLRGLQAISDFAVLKRKLDLHPFSLGSFSEAGRVFDPELLVPIIDGLVEKVSVVEDDPQLRSLGLVLTAVDGTLIEAMPKMLWALWLDDEHRAAKLHLQFELLKGVPVAAKLTDGNGNERTVLKDSLVAGRLYVIDRGYADYGLMADILDAHSSFVVRIRNNASYEVIEQRPISPEAAQQGIVKDLIVKLGCERSSSLHGRTIRLVEIRVREDELTGRRRKHHPRRKRNTPCTDSTERIILLATDVLDLAVELIGLLFRRRWQIELFFRWFKKVLQADRLLSLNRNGLTIVMYCALIASLLVVLWTGRKPTKRTFEAICFYFMGWIGEQELINHLAKLQRAHDTPAA